MPPHAHFIARHSILVIRSRSSPTWLLRAGGGGAAAHHLDELFV